MSGECRLCACLLPAAAPSPVSLRLPKRQLLIPAVGASLLCSTRATNFFFSLSVLLFLFCSEHTEPKEKSEQRLWGLRPATIPSHHRPGRAGGTSWSKCTGCSFRTVASRALWASLGRGPNRALLPVLSFPATVSTPAGGIQMRQSCLR